MTKENKSNGKAKEQNGQKVIPKDTWKEFFKFWDNCEWKDLTVAEIKKNLGNGKYVYVPIPKNVTDKEIGAKWFTEIKEFREKGKPFGGKTISFKGDNTTLETVFGVEELSPTQMNKKLWEHIKKKGK